jgi:endoglucanase
VSQRNTIFLRQALCNTPDVTDFEASVREAIAGLVAPFVDETRVDTLGNLIATRRGKTGFTLMLDALMRPAAGQA